MIMLIYSALQATFSVGENVYVRGVGWGGRVGWELLGVLWARRWLCITSSAKNVFRC